MLTGSIDVNEFAVIDTIASALGDSATAPWIRVGIGDDAAVVRARDGFDQVASMILWWLTCTFLTMRPLN